MALFDLKDFPARDFDIWPFWGKIGPFRGTLGPQINAFYGHFPSLSAQAIFAIKESS
jgi:hypothetical protein